MAETHTATKQIDASPEELFEIVMDLESYPEWIDGMESAEILETTEDGYPLRAAMVADAHVRRVGYTLVYEHDYPTEIRWTSEPGGDLKLVEGAYRFRAQDDGSTIVEYELTIDPGFPIPGVLVRQAQRAIMGSALRGLEAQAAG